jgi:hypothetical protein
LVKLLKVTEESVTSAICSKLRALVENYQPTGCERNFSLKNLYSSIDSSWSPSLELRDDQGIGWINFPIKKVLFIDMKTDNNQIISLKISFSRALGLSNNIFFRANNEIISIKFVEQGLLILQNLQTTIDEIRKEIEKERGKANKLRSLVENSAEPAIRSLLKGTGLSYHINFLYTTLELHILFPHNRVAIFTIPYSKFSHLIPHLPLQIEHIRQSITGVPYTLHQANQKLKDICKKIVEKKIY